MSSCPHHIVQRGHDKTAAFLCDEDDQHYLEVLIEAKNDLGVAVERCQLTGTGKFVDEIERRMGRRVENRGSGRPGK
ncbi:hypothetical protein A3732_26035 [Oleiphilus sp. HI0050]|nr:hypothetical protein A3732_26035 [Oleiphilus sp. HI0050]